MIMITGGLGFLGANLAKYLLDHGEKVLLTQHRTSQIPSFLKKEIGRRLRVESCDVLNLINVIEVIKENKVNSIVHGVSIYQPTESYYKVFQVNVGATMNIMEAAISTEIERVTFLSSRAVYVGWNLPDPVPEEEKISIHASEYIQVTKKAAEILILYYRRKLGVDVRIARVARVYGPLSGASRNPVRQMVESAVRNLTAEIPNSSDEKNDFIYIKDCARGIGIVHLAQHPKYYIYNIGAGNISLLSDFASTIKKFIPSAQINFIGYTPNPNDLRLETCIDIMRISKEFGFSPEFDIEKGVYDYILWIRDGVY